MLHKRHLSLCQKIKEAGGEPYIVGGYVRDIVLGRSPKDIDLVVVGLHPERLLQVLRDDRYLLKNLDKPAPELRGKAFPVFMVNGVEVAVARKENKMGIGHKGFEVEVAGVTLEEDLFRRDLTINAIAMDPFTGKIIDPYGGIEDIQDRILMPVGPHFAEDPLRILRAARFATQLEMLVGGSLITASEEAVREIPQLPGERLWGEIEKALRTQCPSRFFRALDKLGALEVVLPEIAALKGRIQPEKYHPEGDAYVHTLQVVDQAARLGGDDETMFAALVHDLGKAVTDNDNLPHYYNHEALGVPLVHNLCDRLRVPNTHRKVAVLTAKEHLNVHRFDQLKTVKKVRLLVRLGAIHDNTLARRVVMASKADARGRGPLFADQPYEQGDHLLEAAAVMRQVQGHQFAHIKDGRVIAQRMETARTQALKEAGF